MNELSSDSVEYIIAKVVEYANDAIKESQNKKNDDFLDGKVLAYYEVLSTIKTQLIIDGQDPSEFGLGIDLEKYLF